jgi:hypothetical protein
LGLLALMLHCEARREARFSSTGECIPLDQQDTTRWLGNLMEAAEQLLRTAAGFGQTGHYQLEAAIQSMTELGQTLIRARRRSGCRRGHALRRQRFVQQHRHDSPAQRSLRRGREKRFPISSVTASSASAVQLFGDGTWQLSLLKRPFTDWRSQSLTVQVLFSHIIKSEHHNNARPTQIDFLASAG